MSFFPSLVSLRSLADDCNRAVATKGALKVVESMGMADMVDNPDVFTTLEKSTLGMVERVSSSLAHGWTVLYTDNTRSTPQPEKELRASSCLLTARNCHGRFRNEWKGLM
jgi:hypothetical protein